MLSIIIPTLNAAAVLPATLAALAAEPAKAGEQEIVVVDGGSADASVALAQAAGCRVIGAPPGRGAQLTAGGTAARGDWLLFLHADTRLGPGWRRAVESRMRAVGGRNQAGYFRFALDDAGTAARRLERAVAWRCRWLALPYGDQGLVIHRTLYEASGGFRPLPLMEDVDLGRRLGRRRWQALDAAAVTSAAKWRRQGYYRRSARNLLCLSLYFLGLPPRLLVRLYG